MSDPRTDQATTVSKPLPVEVHSISRADDLSFLGQKAVADAAASDEEYRIVGGTMVRLLGLAYPTPAARARATVDADAAVDKVEAVGPMVERLKADDFTQEGGNLFFKTLDPQHRIEVNLLLTHRGSNSGMRPLEVPGVGQVDTLPELAFALAQPGLELAMTVTLIGGDVIEYTTRIPGLEAATVLKAHAWKSRYAHKDLVDLGSLLEIREAHPYLPWRLSTPPLTVSRRDTAHILHTLRTGALSRKGEGKPGIDRLRMSALILRHVATVSHLSVHGHSVQQARTRQTG